MWATQFWEVGRNWRVQDWPCLVHSWIRGLVRPLVPHYVWLSEHPFFPQDLNLVHNLIHFLTSAHRLVRSLVYVPISFSPVAEVSSKREGNGVSSSMVSLVFCISLSAFTAAISCLRPLMVYADLSSCGSFSSSTVSCSLSRRLLRMQS